MKKIFFTVALSAAITLSAKAQIAQNYQFVSPIAAPVVECNVEALHNESENSLDIELAKLIALQKELQAEQKALAIDQKNLKIERKLYDSEFSFLKNRKKQIAKEKKFYQSEVKQYEAYIKDLKKQQETISKVADLNAPAIRQQARMIDDVQRRCEYSKDRCEKVLRELTTKDETDLNKAYEGLATFLLELSEKEARLNAFITTNKANLKVVKDKIAYVKKQIKEAK